MEILFFHGCEDRQNCMVTEVRINEVSSHRSAELDGLLKDFLFKIDPFYTKY